MTTPESGGLRQPIVIAAFEGWNDAGEAASGALEHLVSHWNATVLEDMDPENYYDFQVNRPSVSLDAHGKRKVTWPTTTLLKARPPRSEHDVILVRGVEPSTQWRTYTEDLLARCAKHGAKTLVILGAMLADVPHTRPIPVSATSENPDVLDRLVLEPSRYEGPIGIVGIVQHYASTRDLQAMTLWAAVPHYVGQSPSPKAVLALINRVEELLEVPIPAGTLADDAEAWQRGVDELASEDDDIREYVQQLEEAKDTADLPEASGEAIARDFERYLRGRGDQAGS